MITIAVQYLGTVLRIPAEVPCHNALHPFVAWMYLRAAATLLWGLAGSWMVMVPRMIGMLAICTRVETTEGGTTVAAAPS